MSTSFYIGIDLGTTNSALSYVSRGGAETAVLNVLQLNSPGSVTAEPTLPSFCYIPTQAELRSGALALGELPDLPPDSVCGIYGREQLALNAGRVVQSAKSWLCHSGVSRSDRYLPWGSADVEPSRKLSPIEASARYLEQLKAAWEFQMAGADSRAAFSAQEITITVPASFDDAAQRYTLEAARLAGYPSGLRLLEEPQAAFYRFLELHQKDLSAALPGLGEGSKLALVIDIGGGTTDFSLFELSTSGGKPDARRVAVGDHLLLGGDNIDLAVAHLAEKKLGLEGKLSPKQWAALVYQCRVLKEQVLGSAVGESESGTLRVALSGEGRSLFKSAMTIELSPAEIREAVIEGFFPIVNRGVRPEVRQLALTEFGLPYAADSAVTRYLAEFLGERRADYVLFVGGTLSAEVLRSRLIDVLERLQGSRPVELALDDLGLAVCRGAAHYTKSRAEGLLRIQSAYPRSLYLELESEGAREAQAVCVLPFGSEPGASPTVTDQVFKLTLGRPVRFRLWSTTHRTADLPSTLVELDRAIFSALPPVDTVLRREARQMGFRGAEVDVRLRARLNELGLLALELEEIGADRELWALEFSLKGETTQSEEPSEAQPEAPAELPPAADELIDALYRGKEGKAAPNPKKLVSELEMIFKRSRNDWSLADLRALWAALNGVMTKKGKSPAHEAAWLNLAGFALRPGYGAPGDALRMTELYRVQQLGLQHSKERHVMLQWWIMWRRIAGGLSETQQEPLYRRFLSLIRQGEFDPELVRALAALERLSVPLKIELGELFVKRLVSPRTALRSELYTALSRIAARSPLYGETNFVLPPEVVEGWLEKLSPVLDGGPADAVRSFISRAARLTGRRELDLTEEARTDALQRLKLLGASGEEIRTLREVLPVSETERVSVFGESLPAGLRLA